MKAGSVVIVDSGLCCVGDMEEAMKIDLKTIKRHCHDTGCRDCALDNGGCMFRVPPEQWRLEVMELAILKIATDKARKAMDGRMAE